MPVVDKLPESIVARRMPPENNDHNVTGRIETQEVQVLESGESEIEAIAPLECVFPFAESTTHVVLCEGSSNGMEAVYATRIPTEGTTVSLSSEDSSQWGCVSSYRDIPLSRDREVSISQVDLVEPADSHSDETSDLSASFSDAQSSFVSPESIHTVSQGSVEDRPCGSVDGHPSQNSGTEMALFSCKKSCLVECDEAEVFRTDRKVIETKEFAEPSMVGDTTLRENNHFGVESSFLSDTSISFDSSRRLDAVWAAAENAVKSALEDQAKEKNKKSSIDKSKPNEQASYDVPELENKGAADDEVSDCSTTGVESLAVAIRNCTLDDAVSVVFEIGQDVWSVGQRLVISTNERSL